MHFKRIRDLREDADLTQKEVGAAINIPQSNQQIQQNPYQNSNGPFCKMEKIILN